MERESQSTTTEMKRSEAQYQVEGPFQQAESENHRHFCIHGFSGTDPFVTYKQGSVHALSYQDGTRVQVVVEKILACNQTRQGEYSCLVSLREPLHPDAASYIFPGFLVDEVEPGSPGLTTIIVHILQNPSWYYFIKPACCTRRVLFEAFRV